MNETDLKLGELSGDLAILTLVLKAMAARLNAHALREIEADTEKRAAALIDEVSAGNPEMAQRFRRSVLSRVAAFFAAVRAAQPPSQTPPTPSH